MLRKEEKRSLTKLALLLIGWGIGLDRFYEGRTRDAFLSLLGWSIIFFSLLLFSPCHGSNNLEGLKSYSDLALNPLIVLPISFGIYGGILVIRKAFRLLRSFENSD